MQPHKSSPPAKASVEAEKASGAAQTKMSLRLFVAGNSPHSTNAVQALRKLCEAYLDDSYDLEVIDIRQQPALAREAQILATPTLIKYTPVPKMVLVGDFSRTERVLKGLGIAA